MEISAASGLTATAAVAGTGVAAAGTTAAGAGAAAGLTGLATGGVVAGATDGATDGMEAGAGVGAGVADGVTVGALAGALTGVLTGALIGAITGVTVAPPAGATVGVATGAVLTTGEGAGAGVAAGVGDEADGEGLMIRSGKSRLIRVDSGTGTQSLTEICTPGGNASDKGTHSDVPGRTQTVSVWSHGDGVTFTTGQMLGGLAAALPEPPGSAGWTALRSGAAMGSRQSCVAGQAGADVTTMASSTRKRLIAGALSCADLADGAAATLALWPLAAAATLIGAAGLASATGRLCWCGLFTANS
ncbi:hypothetical protein [Herbaspirillum seropedicae]|uniref:hypothetical protein n=1 Tax=Herbaspirillum seropedicae TaxID=964 RepID=UPI001E4E3243|nr:hypothetical protein [Herbaspirillum seropedicae]